MFFPVAYLKSPNQRLGPQSSPLAQDRCTKLAKCFGLVRVSMTKSITALFYLHNYQQYPGCNYIKNSGTQVVLLPQLGIVQLCLLHRVIDMSDWAEMAYGTRGKAKTASCYLHKYWAYTHYIINTPSGVHSNSVSNLETEPPLPDWKVEARSILAYFGLFLCLFFWPIFGLLLAYFWA